MINIKKIINLLHTIKRNIEPYRQTLFAKIGRGPKFIYEWWTFIVAQVIFFVGKFEQMTDFVRYFFSNAYGVYRLRKEARITHRFPDRTTFERRMKNLPPLINHLLQTQAQVMETRGIIAPSGRIVDTTPTLARGNVWHKKNKKQGIIPKGLWNIDKEAEWGYSTQYHSYYGYKTGIFTTLFPVPVPIACHTTPGNVSDTLFFPLFTESLRLDNLFVLADGIFDADDFHKKCLKNDVLLITYIGKEPASSALPERHALYDFLQTEEGKELYRQRSTSIERLNGLIKNLFPQLRKAIVKGCHRLASAWGSALLLYQTAICQNSLCRRPLEQVKNQIF